VNIFELWSVVELGAVWIPVPFYRANCWPDSDEETLPEGMENVRNPEIFGRTGLSSSPSTACAATPAEGTPLAGSASLLVKIVGACVSPVSRLTASIHIAYRRIVLGSWFPFIRLVITLIPVSF
jgi:hypothetical protein